MANLHLVLTGHWYDMIDRGEKPEEYREITPYWMKRLMSCYGWDTCRGNCSTPIMDGGREKWKCFAQPYCKYHSNLPPIYEKDTVTFQRAYAKNAPRMTFEIESIIVGKPKPGLCFKETEGQDVFIIKLGKRI